MFYGIVGVLKNFANFTGKYLCRVKCKPKSLIHSCSLHFHYINDSCTQSFFSGFCRIFKNTIPLEHYWVSASDFIFDIFKSKQIHESEFSINHFLQKKVK